MKKNQPTIEEWRALHEAAIRIKETAPWEWMTETDIFGLQNPETDQFGFVSVMGMMGEHYAASVYLGSEGLYKFWDFEETGHLVAPERLLEIPQLQLSFDNRNELNERDRKLIKQLGFKFRGQHEWPMFRSYRPGFAPWFLERDEARFLTHALNQLSEVAPRFKENPSLLEPSNDDDYLMRVPRQEGNTLVWEDRLMSAPPPEPVSISIPMDIDALGALKQLPVSKSRLEVDLFMFPSPIQEKEDRPFFPYVLLVIDAQSGMILGNEMLKPEPSLEAMWGLVPMKLVQQLARARIAPKEVTVRSELLSQLLLPLAESLGFKLKQSDVLPGMDMAKEFLFQRFI
jgi:hypothetical protein